ncbi:1291_t:CDS:2, partial [Acaulospora colombiana]
MKELSINSKIAKEGHKQILRRKVVQEESLRNVICSLFVASSLPEFKEQAWPFLQNLCRHFAILEVGEALGCRFAREKRFDFQNEEKRYFLETKVMAEALIETISSENPQLRSLAASALILMHEACVQEWYRKSGGCLGISILTSQLDMGIEWMLEHEMEFVRSLLFILKDMSSEFAAGYVDNAAETLIHVLE